MNCLIFKDEFVILLGCKEIFCVYGKCSDVGNSDFMCFCESGFFGKYCDIYLSKF